MKLVIIFGPQAVGKMTVGQKLQEITDLKLFHNHMTIELLAPFFQFSSEMWRLSNVIREEIFQSFSKSNHYGMIFTCVWAFNKKEDWEQIEKVAHIFESKEGEVYFVELEADLEERIKRNKTPNRLEHKPSKRDVEQSEKRLRASLENLRLNSQEGEIKKELYMKINNTHLDAAEVASVIKAEFLL